MSHVLLVTASPCSVSLIAYHFPHSWLSFCLCNKPLQPPATRHLPRPRPVLIDSHPLTCQSPLSQQVLDTVYSVLWREQFSEQRWALLSPEKATATSPRPQPNLLPFSWLPLPHQCGSVFLLWRSQGEKGLWSWALQDPQDRHFSNQERSGGDFWP